MIARPFAQQRYSVQLLEYGGRQLRDVRLRLWALSDNPTLIQHVRRGVNGFISFIQFVELVHDPDQAVSGCLGGVRIGDTADNRLARQRPLSSPIRVSMSDSNNSLKHFSGRLVEKRCSNSL
jgi:hypothetical protein